MNRNVHRLNDVPYGNEIVVVDHSYGWRQSIAHRKAVHNILYQLVYLWGNINHHHQGKEFNNDLPRYVHPIETKNLDHCGLCDRNVGVKHLMKSEYNTHNNNRKEDIEMLDNGQNSSDPNYATLKNPIHLMRTQRTACIKSSKLRSTHHTMMMPMKSAIKNHNPNGFGLKNQTKNRISNNNNNDNNHHQNDNNQNNNNNLIANTKPNISPMIWLLVSCWKLNLVIN